MYVRLRDENRVRSENRDWHQVSEEEGMGETSETHSELSDDDFFSHGGQIRLDRRNDEFFYSS